ncbi:MAG: hypothetical protein FJZ88_05740, partial [Chloroflexi bacterium]|nr:hypothetical protein [Chloroflexota bacterium]
RFVGRKSSQIHNYVLLAIFITIHSYYTYVQPNLQIRTITIAAMTLILTAQPFWLMLRRVDPAMRPMTFLVSTIFGGYVVVSALRLILLIVFPLQGNDFFKTATPDALTILTYIILTAGLGFSLILMVNRRLLGEIKTDAEELQRSNAELERFAYVASHDLQEPLRMVASYTQLLEKRYKDKLDADAMEFINNAADGATRMQIMIESLLQLSRITTRGRPFQVTDCEKVFQKAMANLQLAVSDSGAKVTHDPLPEVMADDVQLIQLFQNLVANAIKFRREEPPKVHVSARQDGNEWVFAVKDNGIGIAPKDYDRIFVIFQRLHSQGEYPGIGIGLALCKKIVERHGGRIWIESQPGQGSTFYFTIKATGMRQQA